MRRFTVKKIILAMVVASVLILLAIPSKLNLFPTAALAQLPTARITRVAQAQIFGRGIRGNLRLRQFGRLYVLVDLTLQGDPQVLTPGLHGVHIHEKSNCDQSANPPFSSAGGHFDPGAFGKSLPVEANHPYHLGDLPNININRSGRGRLRTVSSRFSLLQTPVNLFDKNGSAIIVHKLRDKIIAGGTAADSGGARIACGVITPVN